MATLSDLIYEFCQVLKNRFIDVNISQIFTELQVSEKVPFTYDLLESENFFPKINHNHGTFKSAAKATEFRNLGNDAFRRRKEIESLKCYIKSVAFAPPNSPELALAYANRSAVLFRLGKYDSCLLDANRALTNNYPDSLKPKLHERKRNCLLQLPKCSKSTVLESISDLRICDCNLTASENHTSNQCDSDATEINFDHKFNLPEAKLENESISNASKKMKIDFTPEMGRHLIATESIEPGEILAIEKPYAAILLPNFNYTHCSFCYVRSESLIPCLKCSFVMFCSERCRENAAALFHDTECSILETVFSLKVSEMEWLAFRTLLVATEQGKQLKTLMNHPSYRFPISERPCALLGKYISEDYATVHNLEDNFTKRCAADVFQRSIAVAVLLHILKQTNFFNQTIDEDVQSAYTELTDSESFAGTLLLKYLFNALSNAHEISELLEEKFLPDSKFTSHNLGIGAGLYPLHSLSNHSCDPNVVRHNHKSAIVSRAIQPIEAGDQLFDNYGYHYATHPRDARRSHLRLQYFFECCCDPCQFDWPLHENLPMKGPEIVSEIIGSDQLEKYSTKFREIAESLGDTHNNEQLDFMCKYLSILHENTRRPSKEYNECQECIKQILAMRANHYRVPLDLVFLKM